MVSCEEIYTPDIDTQESVLVFEGLITDQMGSQWVTITKSNGYNDSKASSKATGFSVQIEGKDGTNYPLTEQGGGNYVSASNVKGEVNHEYRVVAVDPEGHSYESEYETLLPAASLDSLGGEYHQEKWLEKVDGVGQIEHKNEGIRVLASSQTDGFTPYYRYEYNVVYLTSQTYPTQPFKTNCYIARPVSSYRNGFVALANGNLYANQYIVNNPVEYLTSVQMEFKVTLDSMELDSLGNAIYEPEEITLNQYGFLFRLRQYSLSEKGYAYWKAIYDQLNVSGQLFDPVEAQVEGNMKCSSDSSEMVFGYFGASSVTSKPEYFYLRYDNTVTVKPVVYFPELTGTISSNNRFDFWVF